MLQLNGFLFLLLDFPFLAIPISFLANIASSFYQSLKYQCCY